VLLLFQLESRGFMTYLFLVISRHVIPEGEKESIRLFQVTSWGQWMVGIRFSSFIFFFFSFSVKH
jgi:hypothetical protein